MKDKYLFKVQLRGGFSDRNGIKKENVEIQYNNLDERTRTAIINMIDEISTFVRRDFNSPEVNRFWMGFLSEVYCLEIDHMGYCDEMKVLDIIKCTIREDDYDSVLTILEYYVSQISKFLPVAETIFNSLFRKTTATNILKRGGTDSDAGEYLGHKPQGVTARHYAFRSEDHTVKIFESFVAMI